MSAWPALALLLPALVLVSAIYFLAKGDRRAFAQLLALLACWVIGALLMEFFIFMAARMARSGSAAMPVLGTGTRQLLETMASPRSIAAPPLSLAAMAAYSVLAAYLLGAGHLGAAPARQASGWRPQEARQGRAQTGTLVTHHNF